MFGNRKERNRIDGRGIRRADICLMAVFLFLALGCFLWSAAGRKEGQILRISHDGQVLAEMALSQTGGQKTAEDNGTARYCLILCGEGVSCEWYETRPDLTSAVPEGVSYNLLVVSGADVSMEAADCQDQICVHHRPIRGGGESIICLPHKLVAEIAGGADSETPDVMANAGSAGGDVTGERRHGHETDG